MLFIVLIEGEEWCLWLYSLTAQLCMVIVTGNCGYCSVVVTVTVVTVAMCGVML